MSNMSQNTHIKLDLSIIKKQIVKNGIVKYGNFTLKSGKKSTIYFDFKRLISFPELMNDISDSIYSMFMSTNVTVVGVPIGAIPLAANISSRHNIPMLMLRSGVKDHGTKKLIEGETFGKPCIVVEDVTTTGSSVLEALTKLEKNGIKVSQVVIILDREKGALKMLRDNGWNVKTLLTMSDFINKSHISMNDNNVASYSNQKIDLGNV